MLNEGKCNETNGYIKEINLDPNAQELAGMLMNIKKIILFNLLPFIFYVILVLPIFPLFSNYLCIHLLT